MNFYYDFSKKDPVLLTQTIGTIAYMLDDLNVNVMKRVILACVSLYKAAIQVCFSLSVLLSAIHAQKKLVQEHQFVCADLSAWVIALNWLELHMQSKICIQNTKFPVAKASQRSHSG